MDSYFGDLSLDCSDHLNIQQMERVSLANNVLPQFVRRRVPPIPSLRGLVGQYMNSGKRTVDTNQDSWGLRSQQGSVSSQDEEVLSPPLSSFRPTSSGSGSTLVAPSQISSRRSSINGLPYYAPVESKSGVGWKFAYEGCTLLDRAVGEASSMEAHPALTRRLYLDGVAYFLRALPSGLDDAEVSQLQQAMPPSANMVTRRSTTPPPEYDLSVEDGSSVGPRRDSSTITYHLSANATFTVVFLLNLLLPYVRLFVSALFSYERKFQIKQRLIANGYSLGGSVWKQSVLILHQAAEGIQDGLEQRGTARSGDRKLTKP